MISSNLSTDFLNFNHHFCVIWGLFYDIFECSIYYSYCLQAFYRLCRVVFYRKEALLSYSLYIVLIVGQWLLTTIVLLPPLFLNWYVKLPTESFCLVPYTDIIAEVYHIVIIYTIPLVCIVIIYIWITKFIHQSSDKSSIILTRQQRQRNQRDLTVIRRIIILISTLVALRFPTIIFMVYAINYNQLHPLTFSIVGLITSLCLIFIGLITIHITPKLRKYFFHPLMNFHNRVGVQRPEQQHFSVLSVLERNVTTLQRNKPSTVGKDAVAQRKY